MLFQEMYIFTFNPACLVCFLTTKVPLGSEIIRQWHNFLSPFTFPPPCGESFVFTLMKSSLNSRVTDSYTNFLKSVLLFSGCCEGILWGRNQQNIFSMFGWLSDEMEMVPNMSEERLIVTNEKVTLMAYKTQGITHTLLNKTYCSTLVQHTHTPK